MSLIPGGDAKTMSTFKEPLLLLVGLGLLAYFCFRSSSAITRNVSDSFWRKTDYPVLTFAGLLGSGFFFGYQMWVWHMIGEPSTLLFAAAAITIAAIGVGAGRVIERGAEVARSDSNYLAKPEACEGRIEN